MNGGELGETLREGGGRAGAGLGFLSSLRLSAHSDIV